MAENDPRHEIATKVVVYQLAGTGDVPVRRDIPYGERDGEQLTFDVYGPANVPSGGRTPVVLLVTGFPDDGMRRVMGCNAKDMASYVSWARLIAASGLVAITYTNRAPASDVQKLLGHLRRNSESLGIDEHRVGIWACSGNVPNAFSVLMDRQWNVQCAALCYGFMLDIGGASDVAEAARAIRFANPCAGRSLEDLPPDLPLFIARCGRDEFAGVNVSIDRFVSNALPANLPVTLVNHHRAPHAFDINDDSDMSRELVKQILAFLRFHLQTRATAKADT